MSRKPYVYGPTFEEMLYPDRIPADIRARALRAKQEEPLDPINLFNITWKDPQGHVNYVVLDKALTGVDANIVVLYGKEFPTGSHKVGATYSVAMEKQLLGEIVPGEHTLVWPSTGNYGIGGAWVGPRLGYDSLVLLPAEMSQERFERIASYGARYIKTPGCESNVKEIYDKCKELAQDPQNRILNQFEVMGNYQFHYFVTGNSALEVIGELAARGVGNGRVSAYVSAMGSAGTIAAGDRLKQAFYECRIVGLEPIQCPTLFLNGYGGHDIQGIGDKHVTWIHNVMNMDAMMCIDDIESKKGLQLLTDPAGVQYLIDEAGVKAEDARKWSQIFGISGVCNVLGAIKTAKYYGMGSRDNIVTIATDAIDRYHSVMAAMARQYGTMDRTRAAVYLESVFHGVKTDWVQEGTWETRQRWHNLKYYTWVEQQGKTVEELNAQKNQDWWIAYQEQVPEFDRMLRQARGF
ncbi:MAG TPA: pyridoxal-phosphate dependent enzyme [Firmicutes bacterium]|nr:pyridoxal-phosphate dependent enzyme [Bacillota bacterium]